jgi:hypothetical protein
VRPWLELETLTAEVFAGRVGFRCPSAHKEEILSGLLLLRLTEFQPFRPSMELRAVVAVLRSLVEPRVGDRPKPWAIAAFSRRSERERAQKESETWHPYMGLRTAATDRR